MSLKYIVIRDSLFTLRMGGIDWTKFTFPPCQEEKFNLFFFLYSKTVVFFVSYSVKHELISISWLAEGILS